MSSTCDLTKRQCVPCTVGAPPLPREEQLALLGQLGGDWRIVSDHHLERELRFDDFRSALAYVNRVGALAEEEGHHPDLALSFGRVGIRIWTHKIDGLSEADFVLAAKIDALTPPAS
jgi:4a-hydroxytetrahydrobiopterin dehydratase